MSILCAVGDDTPERVVEAARRLALRLGRRVVLAHAFDPLDIAVPLAGDLSAVRSDDDLAEAERHRALARLVHLAGGLAGVEHTTVLENGLPVPVLLRLADEHDAELLVTGTSTRGALDRILAGSVSSELAARAPCPVVVVPEDAEVGGAGPVVAGYDGSEAGRRAARRGSALASALERELVLVRVAGPDAPGAPADPGLPGAVTVTVEGGNPAEELARIGRERDAVLLVTGTRGLGPVTAAVLGSVSSGVVRLGGRPVVLVGPAAG